MRDFMDTLRSSGIDTGAPAPEPKRSEIIRQPTDRLITRYRQQLVQLKP